MTPAQEEQDANDDEMLAQDALVSTPQLTTKQKEKGRPHHPSCSSDDSENEIGHEATSELEQNPTGRQIFKSGPVRAAAKAQVIEAHRIYHEKVVAIARNEDKPVELLFDIVSRNVSKPCCINVWNAFQLWYPEHSEIRCKDNSINFSHVSFASIILISLAS
jgi:hypothetical protein